MFGAPLHLWNQYGMECKGAVIVEKVEIEVIHSRIEPTNVPLPGVINYTLS